MLLSIIQSAEEERREHHTRIADRDEGERARILINDQSHQHFAKPIASQPAGAEPTKIMV
jgi:hypothetical protein